ncbi:MAG: hypothetical protein COB29_00940 [Sulfitobacter sp.]|nr:MAG: hypothetical protein COB29_00940 [Sulfitobacter sp.]
MHGGSAGLDYDAYAQLCSVYSGGVENEVQPFVSEAAMNCGTISCLYVNLTENQSDLFGERAPALTTGNIDIQATIGALQQNCFMTVVALFSESVFLSPAQGTAKTTW